MKINYVMIGFCGANALTCLVHGQYVFSLINVALAGLNYYIIHEIEKKQ